MIAILTGWSFYTVLGAVLLSLAGDNKRWIFGLPAGHFAAAVAVWPGMLALILIFKTGPRLARRAVDLYDDVRDFLFVHVFSRFI